MHRNQRRRLIVDDLGLDVVALGRGQKGQLAPCKRKPFMSLVSTAHDIQTLTVSYAAKASLWSSQFEWRL